MKIAINGFGRIGRNIVRSYLSKDQIWKKFNQIEIVAINDLGSPEHNAHLLKYDSVHGKLANQVSSTDKSISIDGNEIACFSERDPSNLPWKELDVDLVFECTGFFASKDGSQKHLDAGAKRVLISAPATGVDKTIVYGVNHTSLTKDDLVISNASCTTNCFVPMIKVLDDAFGVQEGLMTTTHAYTGDQAIVDGPHSDLRRARAAAVNIIPTSTGAARATGLVLKKMQGKLDGIAMRVPIPDGSVTDFTGIMKKTPKMF